MGRIVVGIDASKDSHRALRWAVEEARLRDADLEVVHAYPTPDLTALPMVVTLPSDEELRVAATSILDEVLAEVEVGEDVRVIKTVQAGGAASVLTQVAEGADLLVVGARGLGGFRGLLMGSVSQQSVTHSPCPVVVLTPDRR
ncbi:MAG: universal stress protein [Nitriliruptor sp.]|nr:MAG: universal stress protein [Nitriliruptor sp.]